jgi:hypothetical protein
VSLLPEDVLPYSSQKHVALSKNEAIVKKGLRLSAF